MTEFIGRPKVPNAIYGQSPLLTSDALTSSSMVFGMAQPQRVSQGADWTAWPQNNTTYTNQPFNGNGRLGRNNGGPAQVGDWAEWDIVTPHDSQNFMGLTGLNGIGPNYGTFDIHIDGVRVVSIDPYQAGSWSWTHFPYTPLIPGVGDLTTSIKGNKLTVVRVTVTGKNTSSSDYYLEIGAISYFAGRPRGPN